MYKSMETMHFINQQKINDYHQQAQQHRCYATQNPKMRQRVAKHLIQLALKLEPELNKSSETSNLNRAPVS